ncbi:hypothetical protein H9Y04_40995 [Streptomyces sp. TRM66268-LWL]|uniref:Fibronectin type-III domain-containing protein n=1 Tax=Streptomyces polyasparticus TaxID=2767826 RepID=A0ABR7SU44_9ACTN|nr:hypothetical protein [Streptomyces polyasparticus]MBC9718923.1 hypothetical protein [Streptomyces polyasparticus]
MSSTGASAYEATPEKCFSAPKKYSKSAGSATFRWTGTKTTTNCSDIHIRPKSMWVNVKVCFLKSDGSTINYCQTNFTTALADKRTTIATDVKDGTKYWLRFATIAASNGEIYQ